ncbi:hypothetical protein [Roseomonas mucosa]
MTEVLMVRLPALVSALAATDYRTPVTIDNIARQLREADLVVRDKRGIGAASQGVREVANLLLGNCADQPKNAVDTVMRFRSLPALRSSGFEGRSSAKIDVQWILDQTVAGTLLTKYCGKDSNKHIRELPDGPKQFAARVFREVPKRKLLDVFIDAGKAKCFGDALEICIGRAAEVREFVEIFTDEGNLGGFDVVLRRPSFEASLILWWEHEGKRKELLSLDYGAIKPRGRKEAARPAASQGFRQTSESIGWQQLHALHVAMAEEAVPAS